MIVNFRQMFTDFPAPFGSDRNESAEQSSTLLRDAKQGHRYEIKLRDQAPFTGVLAMMWDVGFPHGEFLLDDGGYIELGMPHYIEGLTDQGEAEPNERIMLALVALCGSYSSPFKKQFARNDFPRNYCGDFVFGKAWDCLVNAGTIKSADQEGNFVLNIH